MVQGTIYRRVQIPHRKILSILGAISRLYTTRWNHCHAAAAAQRPQRPSAFDASRSDKTCGPLPNYLGHLFTFATWLINRKTTTGGFNLFAYWGRLKEHYCFWRQQLKDIWQMQMFHSCFSKNKRHRPTNAIKLFSFKWTMTTNNSVWIVTNKKNQLVTFSGQNTLNWYNYISAILGSTTAV